MPTVLRIGTARFYFYSNETGEPPHIHVDKAGAVAKFWLQPVSLAWSAGLRDHELRMLEKLVTDRQHRFLEAWYGHFRF